MVLMINIISIIIIKRHARGCEAKGKVQHIVFVFLRFLQLIVHFIFQDNVASWTGYRTLTGTCKKHVMGVHHFGVRARRVITCACTFVCKGVQKKITNYPPSPRGCAGRLLAYFRRCNIRLSFLSCLLNNETLWTHCRGKHRIIMMLLWTLILPQ